VKFSGIGENMHKEIPVMRPMLPRSESVMPYLKQIDNNRWYSNEGPLVKQLEIRFAEKLGVNSANVVLSSSATLALQGACFLFAANTIQVPAYTFAASASSVLLAGKHLELSDIDPKSWMISVDHNLDMHSEGVMIVLPFGSPYRRSEIRDDYVQVVIDAAASLGANNDPLTSLPRNSVIVFSLHATKVFGVGEAGLSIFANRIDAENFRSWINFGFNGSRESLIVGTNAKMSEMTAAYGHAVLDQIDRETSDWAVARQMMNEIDYQLGIGSHVSRTDGISPYWIAEFDSQETRDRVSNHLQSSGIGTRKWWGDGLHRMKSFISDSVEKFPATDLVAGRTLGLPMFRDITSSDIDRVANEIQVVLD
jgi:dTDP-4-amino-4,6-dideoxygalactose transaminase